MAQSGPEVFPEIRPFRWKRFKSRLFSRIGGLLLDDITFGASGLDWVKVNA
jgi:hypothetical protein